MTLVTGDQQPHPLWTFQHHWEARREHGQRSLQHTSACFTFCWRRAGLCARWSCQPLKQARQGWGWGSGRGEETMQIQVYWPNNWGIIATSRSRQGKENQPTLHTPPKGHFRESLSVHPPLGYLHMSLRTQTNSLGTFNMTKENTTLPHCTQVHCMILPSPLKSLSQLPHPASPQFSTSQRKEQPQKWGNRSIYANLPREAVTSMSFNSHSRKKWSGKICWADSDRVINFFFYYFLLHISVLTDAGSSLTTETLP